MNLDDLMNTPLEGAGIPSMEYPGPVTEPLSLDDLGGTVASAAPVAPAADPMTEEQIVSTIAFLTSMGLPPEMAESYRQEIIDNGLLNTFLPMLDLPGALAKYGVGNGGGAMPEWLRLTLGAALIGFTVYNTRAKYALPKAAPAPSSESSPDEFPPEVSF